MMFLNNNDYNSNSLLNSTNNRFNNPFRQNPQTSASFFPSESRTVTPYYQGIPDLRNFGQCNPPVDIRNFNTLNNNTQNNAQNNNNFANTFQNNKNTNLKKYRENNKNKNKNNRQNKNNNRQNNNRQNKNNNRQNNNRQNKNNNKPSFGDFEDLSKVLKVFAKKFIMNFLESKIDDWLDEIEEKVKKYLSLQNIKPVKKETKHTENNINNNFFEVKYEPNQTNLIKETKKEEFEVEPYNTEPFDEPCPLENFNDKIINSTETVSSRLSQKETKEDIENKLNQYKKNYLFGEANGTLLEILNNMSSTTKTNDITNSLKNDMNIKNINVITNEKLNKQSKNFNQEIYNKKVDEKNEMEEDTNDNDLKNFIYDELLSNFINSVHDDKIEKAINNIKKDLLDKNTKNNLQNSDNDSAVSDYESENTSSD